MIGIYKITNQLNGKCYIGQSIDIKTRWIQHLYCGKNNFQKGKLYPAMFQEGIENFTFEVLEKCDLSQEELNNKERYWIQYYNSFNNGYNSTPGGQGEDSWQYNPSLIRQLWDEGYTTGEIKQIVGCSRSTVNNRLQGYNDFNTFTSHQRSCGHNSPFKKLEEMTEKQFQYFGKIIEVHQYSLLGDYIASYPTLEAAAKAVNGKYPENIGECFRGNLHQTAYGYQWSKEKVNKMKPVSSPHGKLVKCIETNQIFASTVEAAKWAGLKSKSGVRECCAGILKSAGKHPETGEKLHWKYI